MMPYLISLGAGLLAGVLYSLLGALAGYIGHHWLAGEQALGNGDDLLAQQHAEQVLGRQAGKEGCAEDSPGEEQA